MNSIEIIFFKMGQSFSANKETNQNQNHSQSNILPKSHDIASSAMENTHNIIGDTIIFQSNSQHEINQHAINQHPINQHQINQHVINQHQINQQEINQHSKC